jgi:uncharacterized damage-inducible protein DinB
VTEKLPEPWLRGPLNDVHPLIMPVLFSFQQVREDLRTHLADVSDEQVWKPLDGVPPLGFHLRHIAGGVDRLVTYLSGEQLNERQLLYLKQETTAGGSVQELLNAIDASLDSAESRLRSINPQSVYDDRSVGRKKLPTTVIGLLIHIAEHTQRHLGQAITTAKFLKHPVDV